MSSAYMVVVVLYYLAIKHFLEKSAQKRLMPKNG